MGNTAVGSLCCCTLDVAPLTMAAFKKKMEGQRRRVQQSPEVFVTIDEMSFSDEGSMKLSPLVFTLNDLRMYVTIEVNGTASEIAHVATQKGAISACQRFNLSGPTQERIKHAHASVGRGISSGKAILSTATRGLSDKACIRVAKKIHVEVVVDMRKEFSEEEVQVVVHDFKCDEKAVQAVMSRDRARRFIESAVSQKASEVATRKTRETMGQVGQRMAAALSPATGLAAQPISPKNRLERAGG